MKQASVEQRLASHRQLPLCCLIQRRHTAGRRIVHFVFGADESAVDG
jgi:hypothetical protein